MIDAGIFDQKARFRGFDYKPIIRGGTDDAGYLCWERGRSGAQIPE